MISAADSLIAASETRYDYVPNHRFDIFRKLRFDGMQYRTAGTNEVISLVYLINNALSKTENGKEKPENFLSRLVDPAEQMSNRLVDDLRKLSKLTT